MSAWLRYTLARIAIFAVALTVLLVVGIDWLWAAVLATVIAFCLSFIFLRSAREAAAAEFAARRPRRGADERAEDADAGEDESAEAAPASGTDAPEAGDGAAEGAASERQRRAES